MNEPDPYFPLLTARWEHPAWRMWCLAFPFARVADARAEKLVWYHADELPPCVQVVVGIEGIPADLRLDWMLRGITPTPDQVRAAIWRPGKAAG